MMAIAILGWPINKLPATVAQGVLEGSRKICAEAGIPLAGGHSIDCPEPVFGLAVTGKVRRENIKKNNTARPGSQLYLTKPLGIGIVTTAQKKGIVDPRHLQQATETMLQLNKVGTELAVLPEVNAMTDVTGFGLLGHLIEMCEGSGLSAEIDFDRVPKFDFLDAYIENKSLPGGTGRNWESYGHKVSSISEYQRAILADPQTSGGLLVSVDEDQATHFESFARGNSWRIPFGRLTPKSSTVITVQ